MAHTIRSALDDGLRVYHLLRGGESYKDRFANADEGLETIALARTARGRAAIAAALQAQRLSPNIKRAVRKATGEA
jgi:CelD/BcsL family acetyltransferase involved in cellulose biosynthesis